MTEQEYLTREQRIELSYREGFINLEEKKAALDKLFDKWNEEFWEETTNSPQN